MKLANLTIVFALLAIIAFTILDHKTSHLYANIFSTTKYNQIFDTAIQDALQNSVEQDDYGRSIFVNKEEVKNKLFDSLYECFEMISLQDQIARENLNRWIPAVVLAEANGFYCYTYIEEVGTDKEKQMERKWSTKQYFIWEDRESKVCFYLGDYVKIWDKLTGEEYEGTRRYLSDKTSIAWIKDEIMFEKRKREVIITAIREGMEQAVNSNPEVLRASAQYVLSIPYIEYEQWYQTVQDVSLLTFFQGIPSNVRGEDYNRFLFSGARIRKSQEY